MMFSTCCDLSDSPYRYRIRPAHDTNQLLAATTGGYGQAQEEAQRMADSYGFDVMTFPCLGCLALVQPWRTSPQKN